MKTRTKWSGTLLIITVFVIDCLCGLWQQLHGIKQADSWEAYSYQLLDFLGNKAWFTMVPYLIIFYMMITQFYPRLKNEIQFDLYDVLLLFIYLVSCIVTIIDYKTNYNMRDWVTDAITYIIATGFILSIKTIFAWKNWRKSM